MASSTIAGGDFTGVQSMLLIFTYYKLSWLWIYHDDTATSDDRK
jgi:hypothetical protein